MRKLVWAVCLLLLAFWTGGTLLLTQLTQWGARQLASGEAAASGETVVQWPVPGWMSVWLDAAWIEAAQGALTGALQTLQGVMPMLGSTVAWLVPLIWVLWGVGVGLLLVLAGGAHVLLGRFQPVGARSA